MSVTDAPPPAPGPVRVLGVLGALDNAVPYVRFLQPFEHLRSSGFELVTPGASLTLRRGPGGWEPDPSLLDGVSLVIFPQIVLSPALPGGERVDLVGSLCAAARRRGIPIVYSPDDYLEEIEPGNPSFEVVSESKANLRTILDASDALIVTTERLRDTLASRRLPTFVLPNAIDPRRWRTRSCDSGELRVGWAGSSSHLNDLRMVIPAIRELQRRLPVRFFILGLVDGPLRQRASEVRRLLRDLPPTRRERAELFLELVDELRTIRYVHEPFGPLDRHFERLPSFDLDVGLCPLLDLPFNHHKSALKFYEYAVSGTLTVASAVTPYREEVSITVSNTRDAWCDALESLLRDPARRASELARQRQFVLRERNIETLHECWAAALREILALAHAPVPV